MEDNGLTPFLLCVQLYVGSTFVNPSQFPEPRTGYNQVNIDQSDAMRARFKHVISLFIEKLGILSYFNQWKFWFFYNNQAWMYLKMSSHKTFQETNPMPQPHLGIHFTSLTGTIESPMITFAHFET